MIDHFLAALKRAGVRIHSERPSIIITGGPGPDEEELEILARRSTPASTPEREWIPGRKVRVITTNMPPDPSSRQAGAAADKADSHKKTAGRDPIAILKERKAELEREVARLEREHNEKK